MNDQPTALILDDDPDSIALLDRALRRALPQLRIAHDCEPAPRGGYDVYLLDNDFAGVPLAAALAEQIRPQRPQSVIVAFSAHLDAVTLKRLINAGCDGAFEKGSPEELQRMVRFVSRQLSDRAQQPREEPRSDLGGTLRSITDLLREWNCRLKHSSATRDAGEEGA